MTNTGENFRRFIEGIGVKKAHLAQSNLLSRSKLYELFKKEEVDWVEIARIHHYLKRHYTYNILDFFPDMPYELTISKGIGESVGGEKEIIRRLSQDRDIWMEKYMAVLEKYTHLQDMYITQIQDLIARQEELMNKLLDKNGRK